MPLEISQIATMEQAITLGAVALLAAVSVVLLILLLVYRKRMHRRLRYLARLEHEASRKYRSAALDSRSLLDQSPQIILVFKRHAPVLVHANPQALHVFDKTSVEALMDDVISKPDAWLDRPHTLIDFDDWLDRARSHGVERREWCFKAGPEGRLWVDGVVANGVFDGQPARIFSATNIHDHKRAQRIAELRNSALMKIMSDCSLEDAIDSLTAVVEAIIPGSGCVIALHDEQKAILKPIGTTPFACRFRSVFKTIPRKFGATSLGSAAYTARRVVSEQLREDPHWHGYQTSTDQLGVASSWVEVLFDHAGAVQGVVAIFGSEPRRLAAEEVSNLLPAVSLITLAIERHGWFNQLQSTLASERIIRQIGVELVNIDETSFVPDVQGVLEKIQSEFGLGSATLWSRSLTSEYFLPVSEGVKSQGVSLDQVSELIGSGDSRYLMPRDSLYGSLGNTPSQKPILLVPITEERYTLIGFLAIQARHVYVASSTIEHLTIIASMFSTALMRRRLLEFLSESIEEERLARKTVEGELSAAREIQMSMVPSGGKFSRRYDRWNLAACLSPAKAVGGDFYDVITRPDGKLLITVGDVSDKGVPAALFMARTIAMLNLLAKDEIDNLTDLLQRLNRELCSGNDACMFVTMVLVLLDLTTGKIEYINAGHNPPLLVNYVTAPQFMRGESGPPLGLYESPGYRVNKSRIEPGSSLIVYSDGVTEAFNESGHEFGEDRLVAVGYRTQSIQSDLLGEIVEEVSRFAGYAPQSDDMTIMTIEHIGVG
ncbi:sigma-B regulation protein RsbU (phosphoserine phosphatase) [Marinobacter pelagius]|uniref:Sigma-B regulation protein RsbU (Phosphoserine phosphatase) n=1 Tax=Marinobacter pelagius TaxID=379482 RepID=A0A366GGN9_9GAMM|nr:GAF domain-containing SpoIIE family protein phosphatase [Marinobacter pelagius]RBP25049.1 sigma-B regulation protein RsbU (phosphoserine phosphatase) [Marinobacter pelagius]